jgi:hypothetical protein
VTPLVSSDVRDMVGPAALPRQNGELVFDAPWQGRVLGMAIGIVQSRGLDWDEFRGRLVDAIAAAPGRPYYESWATALEALSLDQALVSTSDLDVRSAGILP